MNYAEFETFSDSSSENNKKQNHGNYISWTSSEDAILVEQVKKYLENKNIQNENVPNENAKENTDVNNQINNFINNENNENNNINLNKEKNLAEKSDDKNNKPEKDINNILNINWVKISEKFENKNARQCQTRWQNILDPNRVKGPWTKEEDLKLIELVKKFGPEKWSNISTYLPGRLGKQCRERWYNHLNPEVRKTGWSKEEEWALFLLHRKYGNSWSIFSEKIPGRTDNTIKNHWNSIMKKNIVSINNQYQEMIKGKSKEEIEQIEKNIMDKCNQVMNKDYNEYYQEKLKEFPMMKTTKFGKKSKEKNNEENNVSNDINVNDDKNDIIIENKKTPEKIKKKIFENIKVSRDLNKNNKNKNKSHEKNENSKDKKHKANKKQNSAKKTNKYLDINDDKELKILKSGEKILQKDKNILIKEAENKLKEKQKQKLTKDEKKSKLKNYQIKLEENEDSVKSIDNLPTYQNKKSVKKQKKKLGRPKKLNSNKKNKTKFNVSKYSSNNKEKDSPSINNININQKISFQNTFINTNFNNNTNQMNPNQIYNSNDYMKNNNINMPFPMYPNEKYYFTDDDKDYNKMNFNKILITDSKDLNKVKKEAQFPFKIPPTGPFYRSDIKNSSESSGGNNSLGRITPDFRMNPPFIPSNDKYYIMPQNPPLFYNSNPKPMRFIRGNNNNNNNNKISTDSNSIHSYSMNQSMISANSAFKKSSSGSGSGSGRSFQPRANVFNFNNMADLNKEYFSNINLDEKNFK